MIVLWLSCMYIKLWGTLHYQQETWQIFCKELFYLRVVFSSCLNQYIVIHVLLLPLSCCWPKQAFVWKLVLHINPLFNLIKIYLFFFKSLDYETKSTRACSCPTPIWWRQGSRLVVTGRRQKACRRWYESKVEGLAQPDALSTQCARPCSKRAWE